MYEGLVSRWRKLLDHDGNEAGLYDPLISLVPSYCVSTIPFGRRKKKLWVQYWSKLLHV